ncbi:gluconate 2-dehydrogenase subunit 3 family protein [Ancylobacter sp. Lp-2]|uniref:gluconate 2-dehydrogenase subunit 3 family protein n=1 Tax=Ancylobacter sp. Lp-2 TaxID=2881339 RepID=UPI001E46CFA0|nr:gluconate 2-dehydrogenase subunit 3 family protein [Ancylobacter sp. Lp-2]MCB4771170.1 gluconate 2-dehydrogenase subunit 3 family protein [Ancylobacter sp. Lp-2]
MAALLAASGKAFGDVIRGTQPFSPFDYAPPETLPGGRWYFFTPDEARTVEAMVERLIPADDLSMSGKDAGCAEFIDRQLAGSYGSYERLYMQGPFQKGTPEQGDQSEFVPRDRYRRGLAALDAWCHASHSKAFAELPGETRDEILAGIEAGKIELPGFDGKLLFEIVLGNTMEGFFADPIYGGNKDMVSWKMLGFPGARYDYRDYVERHNEKLDLPPLSIAGRPEWKTKG